MTTPPTTPPPADLEEFAELVRVTSDHRLIVAESTAAVALVVYPADDDVDHYLHVIHEEMRARGIEGRFGGAQDANK